MTQLSFFQSCKTEIKKTLSLSIPLVTSQLIYASSGFIGTAMVARLGPDALAASILVSMVWMTLSILFFGMLNSVSILVAHQFGAQNNKAISEIMGQAFVLGVITTIIMIFILSFMPFFLRWSSQPPIVIELATEYMKAMLWTIPALVYLIIYEQFLAGINRAKIVLRISLLVVPIEIPIIYILIFGKLGLPECGVAGIGYGFAITYTLTAIALTLYFNKSKFYDKFELYTRIKTIQLSWLKELVRVGIPMGLMHVIEVGAFTIATFWISQFGTILLAAHQIVMQYLFFIVTLIFAMAQAVTIRVGHAVGQRKMAEIHYAIYIGMLLNFLCISLIAVGFYLIPSLFLKLDLDLATADPNLISYSSILLGICGVLLVFDNFRIIGFGALRGLKDTKFPMYASFFSFLLVGTSTAYILGFTFKLGGTGIWWGMTLGVAVGALIVFIRIQLLLRRVDLDKLMTIEGVNH